MTECVLRERAGGVVCLTLNRPDVLNAFNLEMARSLQAAFRAAGEDDSVRAVVLTGSGRGFCAGQDLAAVPMGPGIPMPDLGNVVREQYDPLVKQIRALPKPVICAVNGVAAGAGANLAFACDIVIAASSASFIQSFTKIGLIPDSGGTYTLPRMIGMARSSALMMLGDKLPAARAKEWGLVWDVCEPVELQAKVMALAEALSTQPTRAFALVKQLLNASFANDLSQQLALEEALQREAGATADFREGVMAFLEKRAPKFVGA